MNFNSIYFFIRLVSSNKSNTEAEYCTFCIRTGTSKGVVNRVFRAECERDLTSWARGLVTGTHNCVVAVREAAWGIVQNLTTFNLNNYSDWCFIGREFLKIVCGAVKKLDSTYITKMGLNSIQPVRFNMEKNQLPCLLHFGKPLLEIYVTQLTMAPVFCGLISVPKTAKWYSYYSNFFFVFAVKKLP